MLGDNQGWQKIEREIAKSRITEFRSDGFDGGYPQGLINREFTGIRLADIESG